MPYFVIALVVICVAAALIVTHFSRARLKEYGDLVERVKQSLDSQNKLTDAILKLTSNLNTLIEEIRKDKAA
jgi:ABC-type transporter Mla subunit MlaD